MLSLFWFILMLAANQHHLKLQDVTVSGAGHSLSFSISFISHKFPTSNTLMK